MKSRKQLVSAKRKHLKSKVSSKRKATNKVKQLAIYKIPRSKLENALEFLESEHDPLVRNVSWPCHVNITNLANANRKVDKYASDTLNVMEVARQCAERGQWSNLMKTVAIMCEDLRQMDVNAILRNSLFGIIADPALDNPSYLEDYLYAYPACKTPGDISYCINSMLKVFEGIFTPRKRRGRYASRSEKND
ncbi:uncharacterized protein LOC131439937 [Malaya genurostris]|uniref:uncharacterized protein LOC131439937 n=1 Tax=Malaya genurostris TaxID=325434 RepID=UPI0026F3B44B|nr:uncharacterized protein LOC131439937 [Malaya genurostris]